MKTVEEKAKAYDKVRKKIAIRFGSNVANEFFAEFEESEDEKVRKELIKHLKELSDWKEDEVIPVKNPSYYRQWASWLENVPVTIDHEKREGFHLGYKACLEKQAEKKPNPVLDIEIPFGAKDSELQEATYYIPKGFHAEIDDDKVVIKQGEQKFEMKTAEESLGIDSDTYNKIVDECLFGEQKQEWSEEDEINVYNIIHFLEEPSMLENNEPCKKIVIDWLKSLRPKNRWKPSELQLECLSDAIEYYNSLGYPATKLKELYEQLKKL